MDRNNDQFGMVGTWELDIQKNTLSWSPKTYVIFGVSEKSFGHTFEAFLNLVHPSDRAELKSQQSVAISTGSKFDLIHRIVHPNGDLRFVREVGETLKVDGRTIFHGVVQDITDLLASALKADETEMLLNLAGRKARLGGWRYNIGSKQLFWTDITAEIHEVPRNRTPSVEDAINFYAPEHRETIANVFTSCIENGTPFDEKLEIISKTGKRVWVRAIGEAERSADGTIQAVFGAFQDISDLTEAREESTHLSGELYLLKAAAAHLNDIIMITDADPIDAPNGPKIVYVNDAVEGLTGYKKDEVLGKTPRILQGPKTRRDHLHNIRRAMESHSHIRTELLNYKKSGEQYWLELDISPIRNDEGKCTHFVSIERDVTERKRNEDAIRISEERFRLVSRAVHDVIWDWEIAPDSIWRNDRLLAVFGYVPENIGKGFEGWLEHIHPDDRGRIRDSILAALKSANENWTEEYRYIRANKSEALVAHQALILRNAHGDAVRMVGSKTDISQRRQMEDRIRQAEKLEAVGQLTGGIAHDFNNLLTVILGNAESIAHGMAEGDKLRPLAVMTMTAAERGAELTNRLLAFARRQPLQPKVVDIQALVTGMSGLLRRALPEDVTIDICGAPKLCSVLIDPGQLEVAILNLAINAKHAMPNGGALTIETKEMSLEDEHVKSRANLEPGLFIKLSVSDNGTGMSSEVAERAFEPFFTTKPVGEGNGLGLSMVYGFVQQSGGFATIYSELGIGTSVNLFLRCAQSDSDISVTPVESKTVPRGNENILVAEDDELVRAHVTITLVDLGYKVISTASGAEALTALQKTPNIALLFTDVVMPGGMNGRELAEEATKLFPKLKVLFTSGYAENALVNNNRVDEGVHLLSKPYRRQDLAEAIRAVLDGGETVGN
jgi:PAS domain S-box-containing protein